MRKFRKTMALMLALAMVLTAFGAVTVSAASFSDTQGHWAESVIDKWSGAGVVNGYSDGTFHPDSNITRAELAKVISTARKYTAEADINFSDVADGDWYVSDLKKCVAQGVIGGYEDNTFRPDNEVTREEAAAMFQRAYQVNSHGLITFADSDQISAWATTAISAMVGTGIINGYEDNTFRPAASITRAEVVKILDGISTVGTEPGATAAPGQNSVSSGTVVSGGLGGSGTGGGFTNSGFGGGGGGSTGDGSTGYSVTFNANGGTFDGGKTTKTVTISRNSVIGGAEPVPTRTEVSSEPAPEPSAEPDVTTYSFAGWYKSQKAADALDDTQKWDINDDRVSSSMTLYAGWYKNGDVTVSFNLNGGYVTVVSGLGEEQRLTEINSQSFKSGGYASAPAEVPTRDHYTFTGWRASPTATADFDFAGTPINVNTVLYAGWQVDTDFADSEVTMPDVTIGSTLNGTVIATPAKAIPGETVSLKVISPDGYKVRAVKSLSYISSITGETIEIKDTTMVNGVVTFTLPAGVEDGTMKLEVYFTAGEESDVPPATAAPFMEDPDQGPGYQAYKFDYSQFAEYVGNKLPANKDFDGLSISKDSDMDQPSSKKTFMESKMSDGTTRSYANRLKIGTNELRFKVYGPCEITIDAVSASSADRTYDVKDSSGKIWVDDFMCLDGAAPTCIFEYTGGPDTLTFKGNQGINIYGIIMYYGEDFVMPTATPAPTPDPSVKHKVSVGEVTNGSVTTDAEQVLDKDGKLTNYQQTMGEKVTVSVQPDSGYKAVGVYTSPSLTVTKESDTTYSFVMPYEDVKVSARCVAQSADTHTVSAVQPDNGTITVTPGNSMITEPVMNSTENFLASSGGGWAVSYDGTAPSETGLTPTAVETTDEAKGNSTNKMMVSDKEVLYALDDAVEGPFTLSYDIYTKGGINQSFRTYIDNAADPVDAATGKATAGGNDNAFFHMTNIKDRIYVTGDAADLTMTDKASKTATMLSRNEFEDGRWFKVYIKGNTNDDTATVEYYRHSTNGSYSASSTMPNAEISSDMAPFVTGRNKSVKQIRLAKATSGNVYYDNIKLTTYNDSEYTAYEGETFTVTTKANMGYELSRVTVTDAAGNVTEAEPVLGSNGNPTGDYIAKVPASDAVISAEFAPEAPADPPAELKAVTTDLEFAIEDYITKEQGDPIYLMDNNVYLSGKHSFSSQMGTSVVGSLGAKKNCLRLTGTTAYMAVMPAYDAEITVYSEAAAGKTIGMGTRPGSCGLYIGEAQQTVHTITVKAGTCVFITGVLPTGSGSDVYAAGLTVKHAGSAAEAAAEPEEEVTADAAAPEETAAEEAVEEAVEEAAEEATEVSEAVEADEDETTDEAQTE